MLFYRSWIEEISFWKGQRLSHLGSLCIKILYEPSSGNYIVTWGGIPVPFSRRLLVFTIISIALEGTIYSAWLQLAPSVACISSSHAGPSSPACGDTGTWTQTMPSQRTRRRTGRDTSRPTWTSLASSERTACRRSRKGTTPAGSPQTWNCHLLFLLLVWFNLLKLVTKFAQC